MGPLLYDMDRVVEAAGRPDDELVEAQREIVLDPDDPEVIAAAREQGVSDAWLEACRRSPVYKMFIDWKIALPLHPEFRTMPSLFYVPPESPMITALDKNGCWESGDGWLPEIDNFRIPLAYLSSMFSAGNTEEVKRTLVRQLALRSYRRGLEVEGAGDTGILERVGLTEADATAMHRMLSLAFLHERFVIPTTRREDSSSDPYIERGFAGFDEMSPRADMKRRQRFHAAPHADGPSR
jgi:nitrate reductase beta subunit